MARYFRKRLLIFIPTLIGASLIIFGLSKLTPGDPVLLLINSEEEEVKLEDYKRMAARLGLDCPAFYFSINSIAYPDTLYEVIQKDHNSTLGQLVSQYGNGGAVVDYYRKIGALIHAIQQVPDSLRGNDYINIRRAAYQLYSQFEDNKISNNLKIIQEQDMTLLSPFFGQTIPELSGAYAKIKQAASKWKLYVPAFKWHGFDNQYHNWMKNFVKGDYGNSYISGRSVSTRIKESLGWTLIMNLAAIFIVFLISIPTGVFAAIHKGSRFDRFTSLLFFILFSLPVFWVATLFLIFFTTPEYSTWLDWFPPGGLGDLSADQPLWDRFFDRAIHMVLPIFCLSYGAFAFVSRQVRGAMLDTINQDYIRTARAKGLSESKVTWRHAFRNSLFPLISLIAMIFPTILAGTVIVEFIFNIPGMGRLVFDSIFAKDWPIVYTVLMLSAVLAMLGNLIGDLLYAWADPRVSYR